jgi:2-dehydro-3-deoxygluconokinase
LKPLRTVRSSREDEQWVAPGYIVSQDDIEVPSEHVAKVLDTTAAGDSFSAGYLAARLTGFHPVDAARAAHRLAAIVIQHPGAIIPRAAMSTVMDAAHTHTPAA